MLPKSPRKIAHFVNKPSRHQRLEDAEDLVFEDETSHLWAVSYADFLMVLLSFFVIFFSIDRDQKKQIQEDIIELTKSEEALLTLEQELVKEGAKEPGEKEDFTATASGGTDKGDGKDKEAEKRMMASVKSHLKELKDFFQVVDSADRKQITIFLPDNIFYRNSVTLNHIGKLSLNKILSILSPYSKALDVTIIGHSDDSQLNPKEQKIIKNNFALSSLRASEALVAAIKQGFPAQYLSIRGDGDIKRNSRTLSILIKARQE